MNEAAGYGLVVSFPDQSASFVHGFEAGGLFGAMSRGDVATIEQVTHTENREVIGRMAVALGWQVEVEASEVAGWDYTKLAKVRSAPDRPNPHGLRVV